jgi:hypothetical protein
VFANVKQLSGHCQRSAASPGIKLQPRPQNEWDNFILFVATTSGGSTKRTTRTSQRQHAALVALLYSTYLACSRNGYHPATQNLSSLSDEQNSQPGSNSRWTRARAEALDVVQFPSCSLKGEEESVYENPTLPNKRSAISR